jgi:hypothetical protein
MEKKSETPPPQIISLGGISTQDEISSTPGRTTIPKPLYDLITINDEEASLEVSLVTLVQIIEDKEPEKASTLGPDDLSQIRPQNDYEVDISLDSEPLDIPRTPMESSRDDLGSGKQGDEIPQ